MLNSDAFLLGVASEPMELQERHSAPATRSRADLFLLQPFLQFRRVVSGCHPAEAAAISFHNNMAHSTGNRAAHIDMHMPESDVLAMVLSMSVVIGVAISLTSK